MQVCSFPCRSTSVGAVHEAAVTLLAASVFPTKQVQGSLHGELRPVPRRQLPSTREGRLLAWSPRARIREAALDPDSPEASLPRGRAGARSMPSPGHALEPPLTPYSPGPATTTSRANEGLATCSLSEGSCQGQEASKGGMIRERTGRTKR